MVLPPTWSDRVIRCTRLLEISWAFQRCIIHASISTFTVSFRVRYVESFSRYVESFSRYGESFFRYGESFPKFKSRFLPLKMKLPRSLKHRWKAQETPDLMHMRPKHESYENPLDTEKTPVFLLGADWRERELTRGVLHESSCHQSGLLLCLLSVFVCFGLEDKLEIDNFGVTWYAPHTHELPSLQ